MFDQFDTPRPRKNGKKKFPETDNWRKRQEAKDKRYKRSKNKRFSFDDDIG